MERYDAFICSLYIHLVCDYVLCSRVLCALWVQGQLGLVLLVQWVPTTPTHTTLDHQERLDHHSK